MKTPHIAGAFALSLVTLAIGVFAGNTLRDHRLTPTEVLCEQTEDSSYDGYTPSHVFEARGIRDMVHKTGETLKCRGVVAGQLLQWPADQIWIARVTQTRVATEGR